MGMGERRLRFFQHEVGRTVIVASQGLEIIAGTGVAIAELGFQRGILAGSVQHVQGQGAVVRMDIAFPVEGWGAGGEPSQEVGGGMFIGFVGDEVRVFFLLELPDISNLGRQDGLEIGFEQHPGAGKLVAHSVPLGR